MLSSPVYAESHPRQIPNFSLGPSPCSLVSLSDHFKTQGHLRIRISFCFTLLQTVLRIFAFPKKATPFLSSSFKLLAKNTGGGGAATLARFELFRDASARGADGIVHVGVGFFAGLAVALEAMLEVLGNGGKRGTDGTFPIPCANQPTDRWPWRKDGLRVPRPRFWRAWLLTFPRLLAARFCPVPASTGRQAICIYHLTIDTDML